MEERRRVRRSLLGPVILITIGVLALLQNLDMLPANFWVTVWRMWPVLLIVIGADLAIGQLRVPWAAGLLLSLAVTGLAVAVVVFVAWQSPEADTWGGAQPVRVERPRDGLTSLSARLDFGMGDLKVSGAAGDQAMTGDFAAKPDISYTVTAGRGQLDLRSASRETMGLFMAGRREKWDVRLTTGAPIDLRIEAAASTNDLDLGELRLSSLRLQHGLAATTLRLPRTGVYAVDLNGGLTTTTVYVPQGLAARIRVEGGLSTVTVDEMRFPKSGAYYMSPDYGGAANRVDLRIEGGLATITVR